MVLDQVHFGCEVDDGFGPMNFHAHPVADQLCVDVCFQTLLGGAVEAAGVDCYYYCCWKEYSGLNDLSSVTDEAPGMMLVM